MTARTRVRRLVGTAGAGVLITAAAGLLAAAPASAEVAPPKPDCPTADKVVFDYNYDGQGWKPGNNNVVLPAAPTTLGIRIDPKAGVPEGCSYPVQLSTYDTQGPTWPTSGTQTLFDFQPGTVMAGDENGVTFDAPKRPCYVEYDLLGNGIKYDGANTPNYKKGVYQADQVATWDGPASVPATCTSPSPTPTPSGSHSPSPSASPSGSVQPTVSATPSAPSGTQLAHTGGNNSAMTAIGAGAGALVVVGAGAYFVARRRSGNAEA